MTKTLVVVESPAKAKTIEKYLGKDYAVKASLGHLRDLPKSQFGVDVDNNFAPKYINIRGKGSVIKSLKDAAKKADYVLLATDPDREGEAIAWHLAHILSISDDKKARIEFNEITKTAIQKAVKHPRQIDIDKVDAQQTRRILDRIVGYKLSPLLWRKVRKGLSAGRVQSVTVKLICDRENEINAFESKEYWSITVKLREKPKEALFVAELTKIDGNKISIGNQEQAEAIQSDLESSVFVVKQVTKKQRRRNPVAPFTTSSLQQEGVRRLGFTTRKTMLIAQQLYEGIELGKKGPTGLITYMRTDAVRISETAQSEARDYIKEVYGSNYVPEQYPQYSVKKSQDAHEAIRPTSINLTPDSVRSFLTVDQFKLYNLIWSRFTASQMNPAVYDTLTIDITAGKYALRSSGSKLRFDGFLIVYSDDKNDDTKDMIVPELEEGQQLSLYKVLPKQHFTEPPPRYTEATLVKTLEELGIGRPSTYSPIIHTILDRGYVDKVEKKFQPTELGFLVIELLQQYFKDIIDANFTASLENNLDSIADGELSRSEVLQRFYTPFAQYLAVADDEISKIEIPVEVSDVPCEKCGRFMVIKQGRYGNFLACPGFPECRNTKPILKETGVLCPLCGGAIIEKRTKRKKKFFGCKNYPNCTFVTWDVPLHENCEACGSFMVRHTFKKGGFKKVCSNSACITNVANVTKSKT